MENQIVQMLQSNNREAISLLYEHYSSALFGVILRIVRSRELAEQVLQDVFVKIWKNGQFFDPEKGRLFTWILNIARRSAIDATRSSFFKNSQKTDDLTSLQSTKSDEKFDVDWLDLRQIVADLDEKHRILIEKIYFEGYTQQEISQELDIPLGTVKTRLRQAVSALRVRFGAADSPAAVAILLYLNEWLAR
jgi:RNA polymerase sigma-70 factor (ECF subfamily)